MKKNLHCIYKLLPASGLGVVVFMLQIVLPNKVSAQTDTTKKLKEVTISTSTIPQVQTITPAQQISSIDFTRNSAFTVADAIRNFAGVNIKDYGGIGGVKTVLVRSLGANHTGIFYDGVQLNDAQNGQIDLGRLNLNNVQSIALYNGQPDNICAPARAFASASLLSIKTIRPLLGAEKPYQVLVGIKGGSFGLINPYIQWQQRINKNWSAVVNSYLEKADGQYKYKVNGDGSDTLATRRNGDIKAQQADAALYWTKSDSNQFNFHVNYYNSDRGLPGAVVFYNPYSKQRVQNRDIFAQAGYEHLWGSSLHLLLNTKLSRLYTHYTDPDFLNNQGGLNYKYTQKEVYQSATLAYHILSNWEVSYAVDFAYTHLDANITNYAYPSRSTLLNAIASNLIVGKWRFQGSLLNSNINESVKTGKASASRNVYSPTLMATFKPFNNSNFQLRAFYKNSFRYPTFDEFYYFAIQVRDLKPEFAKQYDLGATFTKSLNSWLDYVTFTADAYYNNVTDKILSIPNQNPYISSISNLGKVDVKGIDVSIKTQSKLNNNWRALLTANYSFQKAIDVSDPASSVYLKQIPYSPKHTVAINAGIDHRQFGIYYNQVLSSSRYYSGENLPENLLSGYSVSDASAVYNFLLKTKQVTAAVEVNNLFNANYAVIRSFPLPGRSYRFTIQIKI
ncbi:TonB-dependent receptor [Mucilaginibacter sabulilitoris]|uniref:TonB-dependent receptor n=1 Tax=Mucilaginibacter sabulilitoris TaxID=1173583 RepID=A0ABZ0THS0_9SPHI|nr:TonB-dependent receptor [Mucilaginibacter sabulilitoris]WPU91264.1 TonB-dependent receptor [Mucilaginibacter sabulilitoris]